MGGTGGPSRPSGRKTSPVSESTQPDSSSSTPGSSPLTLSGEVLPSPSLGPWGREVRTVTAPESATETQLRSPVLGAGVWAVPWGRYHSAVWAPGVGEGSSHYQPFWRPPPSSRCVVTASPVSFRGDPHRQLSEMRLRISVCWVCALGTRSPCAHSSSASSWSPRGPITPVWQPQHRGLRADSPTGQRLWNSEWPRGISPQCHGGPPAGGDNCHCGSPDMKSPRPSRGSWSHPPRLLR